MKVPPPKNLIVCVKPPQTIVRQCVLAAVAYVSALCGAAHAQSAPVAPPLSITDAVQLTHATENQKTYTIERSTALQAWQAVAGPFFGNGTSVAHSVPVSFGKSGYFRVRVDTRPAIGRAPWLIAETSLVLNGAAGPRSLMFNANGTGVQQRGAANQSFSWTWRRTGMDTGVCTLVHESAERETLEMTYAATGSGAFSSQRSKEGVPAGSSAGTFRNVTDSSLFAFMPAALGHEQITFAGYGRPSCVEVKTDGTAVTSGPAGDVTSQCTYILKTATTAELRLNAAPDSEIYSLTFTGPSCGTFTCKGRRDSVLRREFSGSFTIATQP
jgi:hypothetical protein